MDNTIIQRHINMGKNIAQKSTPPKMQGNDNRTQLQYRHRTIHQGRTKKKEPGQLRQSGSA